MNVHRNNKLSHPTQFMWSLPIGLDPWPCAALVLAEEAPVKPSCLYATLASFVSHVSSQIVLQTPLSNSSTRPYLLYQFEPKKALFPTIGSDVAIWLANLLLSIRVKTTRLASTCHVMIMLCLSRFIVVTSIVSITVQTSLNHCRSKFWCTLGNPAA